MPDVTPRLISTRQLCKYLGCSKSHFYASILPTLRIKPVILPGVTRWDIKDVDAYIASRKAETAEDINRLMDARRGPRPRRGSNGRSANETETA